MAQMDAFNNFVSITFNTEGGDSLSEDDACKLHTLVYLMARRFGWAEGDLMVATYRDGYGGTLEYYMVEVDAHPDFLTESDLIALYDWADELNAECDLVTLTIGDETSFWGF